MSLTIQAPEIERRVRHLAKSRGLSPEEMLLGLVEAQLPREESEPQARPFYETATTEEWAAALDRWAARFPSDAPLIPDEALRRENLYEDRGL